MSFFQNLNESSIAALDKAKFPNQSPIDVSRDHAESCDLLCEFRPDDDGMLNGQLITEGITTILPASSHSAQFQGKTVSLQRIVLTAPSQHTVAGNRFDGEIQFNYGNVIAAIPIRKSARATAASEVLKGILANISDEKGTVEFNVKDLYPSAGTPYFVYTGNDFLNAGAKCEWVVYAEPVNVLPDDFAVLEKIEENFGYRNLQDVGKRKVFYNSGIASKKPEGSEDMPHDGRIYMKCGRVGEDAQIRNARIQQEVEAKKTPKLDVSGSSVIGSAFHAAAGSVPTTATAWAQIALILQLSISAAIFAIIGVIVSSGWISVIAFVAGWARGIIGMGSGLLSRVAPAAAAPQALSTPAS